MGGDRSGYHDRRSEQEVNQPPIADACEHIEHNRDARQHIRASVAAREAAELQRRAEYEREHGTPGQRIGTAYTVSSLRPFTEHLRTVSWPASFKLTNVENYMGDTNPESWLQQYETAVRAAGGNEAVMANYLPVVFGPSTSQWFMSLPEGKIDTWAEFKSLFINTYKSTCKQPGTKYDLNRVRAKPGEALRSYVRRFSEARVSIPDIAEAEVITAFINGLGQFDELRKALHRK